MNKPRKASRPATVRAFGYIRVSTGFQAINGAGLEAQRQAVTAEIAKRGWELIAVIEDAGQSGTVKPDDRPGLGPSLAALDEGAADALVALKVDRVSRSTLDFASLVERADKRGWQLVTLDMPLDPASPIGRATRSMLATFAQLERDFISQRTAEALAIKREQGIRIGRPRQVTDDLAARIRRERDSGASWQAIADRLNADGIPGVQGGKWWPMTVRRIANVPDRP